MLIYKICSNEDWAELQRCGIFTGSAHDKRDGFLHFSTAEQLSATAAKHFEGQTGLMLLTVDSDSFGHALRFEPSRNGALFPHLYGPLPRSAVMVAEPFLALAAH